MAHSNGKVLQFMESKLGLLLFGFVLAAILGSLLGRQIVHELGKAEQRRLVYKARLGDARGLEQRLLSAATGRSFYLNQTLARLAHPEEFPRKDEVKEYWRAHVGPAKDHWNKKLYLYYAQTRTLFSPELATMLVVPKEGKPVPHDPELVELAKQAAVDLQPPPTLNAALMQAHATVYALVFKCDGLATCDAATRKALYEVANRQMAHLATLQGCFAYRMAAEMRQHPYGPDAHTPIELPEDCHKFTPEKPGQQPAPDKNGKRPAAK